MARDLEPDTYTHEYKIANTEDIHKEVLPMQIWVAI